MATPGPRNNLQQLLKSHPPDAGVSVSSPRPPVSSSARKGPKFKPASATLDTKRSAPPSKGFHTPRAATSSTHTPIYGGSVVVDVSSGSSPTTSEPSRKRSSPDPPVAPDEAAPTKRTRLERTSDKENIFSHGFDPKGKSRATPTAEPRPSLSLFTSKDSSSHMVPTAPPAHSTTTRALTLDYSDLLNKSEADLYQEYQDSLDFRNELMDWRHDRGGTGYIADLLKRFDDLVNDRVISTKAVLDARKCGQPPLLPPPRWAQSQTMSRQQSRTSQVTTQPTPTATSSTTSLCRVSSDSIGASRAFRELPDFVEGTSNPSAREQSTQPNFQGDSDDDELWAQVDPIHSSPKQTHPPSVATTVTVSSQQSGSSTFPPSITHPDMSEQQIAVLHQEIMDNLRRVFRLEAFRPNQYDAVLATLLGYDTFVLMATGGGKSLCYQLAALCQRGRVKGLTVVVTPLLALMVDQISALEAKNIDVVFFNGDQSSDQFRAVQSRLSSARKPSLLYVTPEKLDRSQGTRSMLKRLNDANALARFVVDEAHCVSAWGRGFRESYTALSELKKDFPNVPIMALTATATPQVEKDVINILGINNCKRIAPESLSRPNLFYEVRPKGKDVQKAIAELIAQRHRGESGIVYCSSREKCEQFAMYFRNNFNLTAKHFHANMDAVSKRETQEKWSLGECQIIVATIAFGMGIDKPDVRFVIHSTLPERLDSYYQETGRAGRDGLPASCVLYYSMGDTHFMFKRIEDDLNTAPEYRNNQKVMLRQVMQYCHNDVECRRTQVLLHFGENFSAQNCNKLCDNCCNAKEFEEKDMSELALIVVKMVKNLPDGHTTTRSQFASQAWERSNSAAVGPEGKSLLKVERERLVDNLLVRGILENSHFENRAGFPSYKIIVTPAADEFLRRQGSNYPFKMYFKTKSAKAPRSRGKGKTVAVVKPRSSGARGLGNDLPDDPIVPYDRYDDEGSFEDPQPPNPGPSNVEVNQERKHELYLECRGELTVLREKISKESGLDLEFVLPDEILELFALQLPADMDQLKKILVDEEIDPRDISQPALNSFLNVCTTFNMREPKNQYPSVDDLHKRYDYQIR